MNRYRINDIKLAIDAPRKDILSVLEHRLSLRAEDVFEWEIRRQSIDARDRSDVHYVFAVDVLTQRKILKKPGKAPVKIHGLSVQYIENEREEKHPLSLTSSRRPVVVGMGHLRSSRACKGRTQASCYRARTGDGGEGSGC